MDYSHDLYSLAFVAVDNEIIADWPKENRMSGEVRACVTDARIMREHVKGPEESFDEAVRGSEIVFGDVIPDLLQIALRRPAKNVVVHGSRAAAATYAGVVHERHARLRSRRGPVTASAPRARH